MLRIARLELEKAKEKKPGWANSVFIAITLSALAIEALANAVGDRVIVNWPDHERERPLRKLEIVAAHLDVPHSYKAEPWKTIKWLSKLRNDLAHAKPEKVKTNKLISAASKSAERADAPDSQLEKQLTVGKAKSAYDAVEALKLALCDKIPAEKRFGLFSDGWSTSTQIEHEA